MAIPIKTSEEIQAMREGGRILAEILEETCKISFPGVSTLELDRFAENLIRKRGAKPAFKGYKGYPMTLCTNINEVIVHGIPKKDVFLTKGDLLTIDCGIFYKGLCTDAARSIPIGRISAQKEKLLKTAHIVLEKATNIIKPGIHVNEIGKIIQKNVENAGFHIIYDLTGHGVGRSIHEEPVILNYWEGKAGPLLQPGMTLAIEPIFAGGTSKMKVLEDKWTIVTIDKSCAVQVENTVLVTENSFEVLTR